MALTRRRPGRWLGLCVASLLLTALWACSTRSTDEIAAGAPATANDIGGNIGDAIDGGLVPDADGPKDAGKDVATVDAGPQPCVPDCLPGYACHMVGGAPVCLVASEIACASCSTDLHCLGGRCEQVDGQGPFCLIPCPAGAGAANCPEGTICAPGVGGHLCRPVDDSCTCLPKYHGKTRTCAADGVQACPGFQLCAPGGWLPCSVPEASPEICDGLDNDCDGQTDEGLATGAKCSVGNDLGSCVGQRQCEGADGWQCSAPTPAQEACNGQDDDCDGVTDEPWLSDGKYVGDAHCGLCGNDCVAAYDHGVGACEATGFPPHCVLAKCDEGWVPGLKGCVPKPPDPCTGPDCPCTPALAGKIRSCSKTSAAGTCQGVEICKPGAGWTGCTAKAPLAELCNGIDDDCDGGIDEDVGAGDPCTNSNPAGSCVGVLTCGGSAGSWCEGPLAKTEVCNGADDDCDGKVDEGFVDPGTGTYLSAAHCGDCATSCAQPAGAHVLPVCAVVDGGGPTCQAKCEPGWLDANAAQWDGCECHKTATEDTPGGGDANCDGVDGDVAKSVFVAKTGDDANPGTRLKPVFSIAKGIALAKAAVKRDVLIGAGAFAGDVNLIAGVSIWGGYSKTFAVRDPDDHETVIVGTSPQSGDAIAVRCENIGGPGLPTRLDGLTVLGGTPKQAGRSSFAVYASACDGRLALVGNRVFAGNGAPGGIGIGGAHGAQGKAGTAGKNAKDIGHPFCQLYDHSSGGKGGVMKCGASPVDGGGGGTAICPDFDEATMPPLCPYGGNHKQTKTALETGKSANGPGGGKGGVAGNDGYVDPNDGKTTLCKDPESSCSRCETGLANLAGSNGASGSNGVHGDSGQGCATPGVIQGGAWQPGLGSGGGAAAAGGGGGGGGAAGGVEVIKCAAKAGYSDIGGSGGGGGSGGCGGLGGGPGGSGGAAFAVLVIAGRAGASAPKLQGNSLHGGKGGDGGAGGAGGYGGFGGLGAAGGANAAKNSKSFCAAQGGAGGKGGQGGHGGGGGGGCGGSAALIAAYGLPASVVNAWKLNNKIDQIGAAGKPGLGGNSAGTPGEAGAAGVATATLSF